VYKIILFKECRKFSWEGREAALFLLNSTLSTFMGSGREEGGSVPKSEYISRMHAIRRSEKLGNIVTA